MSPIFISEIMRFVKNDEIDSHLFAAAQRVEQLVAKNFSCADDQRRVGILFAITGQYPDVDPIRILR